MNNLTTDVLKSALDGLMSRQRAIADNIANIQTPGFLARRVDFESKLQQAVSDGDTGEARAAGNVTVSRSLEGTREDGNNVNLDDETVLAYQTNLRYQTTVQAMNAKFQMLRTAMGKGGV